MRAVTAVATLGASELVGAGASVGKALVKGENVGDAFTRDRLRVGPVDRFTGSDLIGLAPGNPLTSPLANELQKAGTGAALETVAAPLQKPKFDAAAALDTNPTTSPLMSPALSPSASLRRRRNFSTILTSPLGALDDANVSRTKLLGGRAVPTGV